MKYLFTLLISIIATSLVAQKNIYYYGWEDISNCNISISNNNLSVHFWIGDQYLVQYPDFVKDDTLFFSNLRILVWSNDDLLDTILHNTKLLLSVDSISILETEFVFLSKNEQDRLLELNSKDPFNIGDPCMAGIDGKDAYQVKRLIGRYKIDSALTKKFEVSEKYISDLSSTLIIISSDSTGYILHYKTKNKFTFSIQDCYIQIKTIEKPFNSLNFHEGTVIRYMFDRILFKSGIVFVNTSRKLKWK